MKWRGDYGFLLMFFGALAVLVILFAWGTRAGGTEYRAAGGSVDVVTLDDGTRCAVYDGFFAGGIDCDWNRDR